MVTGEKTCFVYFNCAGDKLEDSKYRTPEIRCDSLLYFFKKYKIDCIGVGNYQNHWYQTEEMFDLINRINVIRSKCNYEHIITYGGSMGAYAALTFSKVL